MDTNQSEFVCFKDGASKAAFDDACAGVVDARLGCLPLLVLAGPNGQKVLPVLLGKGGIEMNVWPSAQHGWGEILDGAVARGYLVLVPPVVGKPVEDEVALIDFLNPWSMAWRGLDEEARARAGKIPVVLLVGGQELHLSADLWRRARLVELI